MATVMGASAASAQLSERPGTSTDTSLGPKDLSGKSIKDPRVRVVHSDDPSKEGTSRFLQDYDPWLAYQRGKNLTQREFRARDGVFGRTGFFFEPKLLGDRMTPRLGRDHVSSCGMCHNIPYRDAGAGVTFPKGGGEGRNTPHFFGGGLIEMLGLQTRLKVLAVCDPARRGFVAKRDAPTAAILVRPMPGEPPIDYGWCGDRDGDGRPDLNKIFRVWYVDEEGRRVTEDENGDGVIDLRDGTVAGYNLEMMVFGWGETEGAMAPTLRVFFNDPIDIHSGMQAYDPTIQIDDGAHGDEGANDGLARVSNAGARQFTIHAPADRGTRLTASGLSLDDPDGDGFINEISEGDVDLAEWYMLNAPAPGVGRQTSQTRRGRVLLAQWRCTACHTPDWLIEAAAPDQADPYRRYDGDRRFFDLAVAYRETTGRLEGKLVPLAETRQGLTVPRRGAAVVKGLFSDLKHHDMGESFAETLFNGARLTKFRTAPLWGVGTSAPYGHDGRSLTLDDVIRRHGGEAAESAAAYRRASPRDREALLAFLNSLVLYQNDNLPTDLDGDGVIAPHFIVAGRDTGEERFNPEWLFRTPCKIEGPVRAPDGTHLTSLACVNVVEAYGESLAFLRDTDQDGFPDATDPCPDETDYQTGCPVRKEGMPQAFAETASLQGSGVSLAIDPQHPSVVYAAATDGGGIRKSRDGGRSWRPINTGLGSLHVNAVVVDPVNPLTLYAATARGVFRSPDEGTTWLPRNDGLSDVRVFALAVSARSPGTVYAGGFGGRVSISVDRGEHWSERRVGLPVYRVTALLADPGDSSVPALDHQSPALYAATSGGGTFRSLDGGGTWTPLVTLAERTVYTLVRDPRVPETLYAGTAGGVYKSADRGTHWERLGGAPDAAALSLAIDPAGSGILYVGTPDGVAKSLDGGRRWTGGSPASLDGAIVSLVVDPWNSETVYAGRFGGAIYRSLDGGMHWKDAAAQVAP
ncbi:MAG: hypothetical protein HY207_05930 [Nitrospirae bacterium]|nr:hypothetical protein [Nitrospirota bacterium]